MTESVNLLFGDLAADAPPGLKPKKSPRPSATPPKPGAGRPTKIQAATKEVAGEVRLYVEISNAIADIIADHPKLLESFRNIVGPMAKYLALAEALRPVVTTVAKHHFLKTGESQNGTPEPASLDRFGPWRPAGT